MTAEEKKAAEDEAEKLKNEEEKKKERAAMRAKLLAPFPDKVNSKLAVLDKNKPVVNPVDRIKAL
jgi:hypothetical protein